MKILSIGNSFSVDTMEHTANILLSLGVTDITLGNLYIGGCSIRRHYQNITENLPLYEYLINTGDGWTSTFDHTALEAVRSQTWDIISIQHGTADGSRNSDAACYEHLAALVALVKEAAPCAKIAFNMTWVGEPYHSHPEIVAFGGDTAALYRQIAEVMRTVVVSTSGIDVVSPTGTAIQNIRAETAADITRDGYHLSLGLGRYVAGLTFVKALTGLDIAAVTWKPDDVTDEERLAAIAAATVAVEHPFV